MDALDKPYLDHVARLQIGYARVLAERGFDAIVLHSGTQKTRSDFDDQHWPLRVVPHFAHWLPLAVPDCALIVGGARPKLIWCKEVSFWEQPAEVPGDHWQAAFEV